MANIREIKKQKRIKQIQEAFKTVKKEGKEVNQEKLISLLIIEYGITRKTALEEINAVVVYDSDQENL